MPRFNCSHMQRWASNVEVYEIDTTDEIRYMNKAQQAKHKKGKPEQTSIELWIWRGSIVPFSGSETRFLPRFRADGHAYNAQRWIHFQATRGKIRPRDKRTYPDLNMNKWPQRWKGDDYKTFQSCSVILMDLVWEQHPELMERRNIWKPDTMLVHPIHISNFKPQMTGFHTAHDVKSERFNYRRNNMKGPPKNPEVHMPRVADIFRRYAMITAYVHGATDEEVTHMIRKREI